ncbi:MAG TPA: molybdopterin-dependent oxidoreductase [Frankiaceae bacterium]|nr:molybdopterin-dependent oxidoreductase [Frankiaceae bacterium]
MTAAFGYAGATNSLDDVDLVDCFLVVGSNTTEAHPVVGARIRQRVLNGAGLVVVDPRRTELAALADVHLPVRPGSNVAVFHGLARLVLELGYADEAFLRDRAEGMDALRARLDEFPPDRVAMLSGVDAEALRDAARRFGSATFPAIVYGLGVTEHAHGTDGVRALANLAILRGAVGTDRGAGVNPLRGQNNVQGACDMGALPDLLPGYQPVVDPDVRARFSARWGAPVPERPGMRLPEMLVAAGEGRVRALWLIGGDVLQTYPASDRVRGALAVCDLVVCHEVFPTATAAAADVVLPVATFLEKNGTFTNSDRRFQRVRPALAPPRQVRDDFTVLRAVARALGTDLGCPTPAATLDECAALSPLFAGVSHDRLDAAGFLHWPCWSAADPGEPAALYRQRFATPSGRAVLSDVPWLPPGEEPDLDYTFVLVTGRRLVHYNSGSMTRRTPNRRLLARETLDVHPGDAARLGLGDDDRVRVVSRRAETVLAVRVTDEVRPGELFCAFHFPEAGTNALTSEHADTHTGCPEYKVTAVRLAAEPGCD